MGGSSGREAKLVDGDFSFLSPRILISLCPYLISCRSWSRVRCPWSRALTLAESCRSASLFSMAQGTAPLFSEFTFPRGLQPSSF